MDSHNRHSYDPRSHNRHSRGSTSRRSGSASWVPGAGRSSSRSSVKANESSSFSASPSTQPSSSSFQSASSPSTTPSSNVSSSFSSTAFSSSTSRINWGAQRPNSVAKEPLSEVSGQRRDQTSEVSPAKVAGERSMGWNIAALVAVGLLVTVFIIMMVRPDTTSSTMAINGDTLGPEDETMSQYQQRSDATLQFETAESGKADNGSDSAGHQESSGRGAKDSKHWALVTFNPPTTPAKAAEALDGSNVRVGSVLVGPGVVSGIPNPTPGYPLEKLFSDQVQWANELEDTSNDDEIPGVIVYGTLDQLRAIRKKTFAVEALPSDAVWGRIGVRNPAIAGLEDTPASSQDSATSQDDVNPITLPSPTGDRGL
ncbi:hypothetical protein [Corynebacterium parakroppenstedtii]|uniref:hypothetical protein n=1 Tax=Corynebacterium parakroppenstedtii TaxID=2828363 RepID=UPI001C8D2AE6|nr:hypothetical protein [Corynebacterium parakroppenstedtii]MBY0789183.1 hypothetical protein [Corynebacterium parakroppenstedtii]